MIFRGALPSLPFSSALLEPQHAALSRLERLLRQLDAIADAHAVLSDPDEGPRLLLVVRWRGHGDLRTALLARDLAVATLSGLEPQRVTLADTGGQVWLGGNGGAAHGPGLLASMGGSQAPGDARAAARGSKGLGNLVGAAVVGLVAGALAGLLVGLIILGRRKGPALAGQEPLGEGRAPEVEVAGRRMEELLPALRRLTPSMRGAVLSHVPDPWRSRLVRALGGQGAVEWPSEPPPLILVAEVLAAGEGEVGDPGAAGSSTDASAVQDEQEEQDDGTEGNPLRGEG